MLDKTVITKNKKFIISCQDMFLAKLFIEECCKTHKDYELKFCYSAEDFGASYEENTIFDGKKQIVVLMNFYEEDVSAIESTLDWQTDNILILVEQTAIRKNKAYTRIRGEYCYQKLEALSERECRTRLHTYMLEEGLKFSSEIPAYIIKIGGTNIGALANEIKKLTYLNKEVTEALCDSVITKFDEASFYEFIDHFSHKRTNQCLQEFNKISEDQYVPLLHFMIGYVDKLYKMMIFREQKKSAEDIAGFMGLPKFIVQTKYFTSMSMFNKVKLLRIMDLVNELDTKLRLTKYDTRLVFESYLLKMLLKI